MIILTNTFSYCHVVVFTDGIDSLLFARSLFWPLYHVIKKESVWKRKFYSLVARQQSLFFFLKKTELRIIRKIIAAPARQFFFPYTFGSIIDCILEASHFDDREHPNLNFSPNLIVGSILIFFLFAEKDKCT